MSGSKFTPRKQTAGHSDVTPPGDKSSNSSGSSNSPQRRGSPSAASRQSRATPERFAGTTSPPSGSGVRTWTGRTINVAHRRTPSELTPLIQQNLALQQQVEMLQAQNQHMLAQQQLAHQMLPPQIPPQLGNQMAPQPMGLYMTPAMAQLASMGPPMPQLYPPPPFGSNNGNRGGNGGGHVRQKSSQASIGGQSHNSTSTEGSGHARRHSLAVSEARKAAHQRAASTGGGSQSLSFDMGANTPGFQFPASSSSTSSTLGEKERSRPSQHSRSTSTASSGGRRSTPSPSRFQFPPREASSGPTAPSAPTGSVPTTQHNRSGSFHRRTTSRSFDFGRSGNNNFVETAPSSGGRKSLFVPYLSQASVPAMVAEGLLVIGTLRVNHKNRSDAYVTTDVLDADVFICGSKDRNRALEGDLVAVELLDVDEVWDQKLEKEKKKRRRDAQHSTEDSRIVETADGALRRRGSLRQRAPQKRNDDVEVEGQMLLLREEYGAATAADLKPLYAGHVVAILERPAGQLFSGNLGLLRPSSQVTKDRQNQQSQSNIVVTPPEKPKIVWFKPTDKCVPLMAIPTEQAPADLVENPQKYADQIFVAQVKRWPITSLHPFGTIVEELGAASDPNVVMLAVLRDHNFGAHKFNDGAVDEVHETGAKMAAEAAAAHHVEAVLAVSEDMALSRPREGVVRVHVLDLTPNVRAGSLLDRELRHKSAGVYMKGLECPLLPHECAAELGFKSGRKSPALTVEIVVDEATGEIASTSVSTSVVEPGTSNNLDSFARAATALRTRRGAVLNMDAVLDVCVPARPPLTDPTSDEAIIEELAHQANAAVARKLLAEYGPQALVRWQPEPQVQRLEDLASLLRSAAPSGSVVDTSTANALANTVASLFSPRQITALKAAIAKLLPRQKYSVSSRVNPTDLGHYWFEFPVYTHFSAPLRRYADHVVHRQLHALLAGDDAPADDDNRQIIGLSAELSFRYDCARAAQGQSIHLRVARESLTSEYQLVMGVVSAVYESAFDVVIPELSVEKRVHGDQLPLVKAEFHPAEHMVELFWDGSADSATYVPENVPASEAQTLTTREIAARSGKIDLKAAKAQTLRPDEHVQEVRPLQEVAVLIRVDAIGRVLPSIIVRAVNPFIDLS